jgi:hypothetical protein
VQPYTVLLQHGGEGPPHVHHVTARGPVAAYMEAVVQQEIIDVLTYDVGLGRKLSLEQAAFEWPLLMVCEGHIEMQPVLSAAELFERASQERVEEPELAAS